MIIALLIICYIVMIFLTMAFLIWRDKNNCPHLFGEPVVINVRESIIFVSIFWPLSLLYSILIEGTGFIEKIIVFSYNKIEKLIKKEGLKK